MAKTKGLNTGTQGFAEGAILRRLDHERGANMFCPPKEFGMESVGRPSSSEAGSREVVLQSVHRRLDLYALAAGAAGVSLIALSAPAEGEVVYTPTSQKIGFNHPFELDLNNDGSGDFQIVNKHGYDLVRNSGFQGLLGVKPTLPGNRAVSSSQFAAALPLGASIGGAARFPVKSDELMAWGFYIVFSTQCCGSLGPWRNVQNRYLGLRFTIDGETHYGWARFNVKFSNGWFIAATLTGYAYETEANKTILAGQTAETADAGNGGGSSEVDVLRKTGGRPENSLGGLALGFTGRRE